MRATCSCSLLSAKCAWHFHSPTFALRMSSVPALRPFAATPYAGSLRPSFCLFLSFHLTSQTEKQLLEVLRLAVGAPDFTLTSSTKRVIEMKIHSKYVHRVGLSNCLPFSAPRVPVHVISEKKWFRGGWFFLFFFVFFFFFWGGGC